MINTINMIKYRLHVYLYINFSIPMSHNLAVKFKYFAKLANEERKVDPAVAY